MNNKYRIREIKYDNGNVKFLAQYLEHLWALRVPWLRISKILDEYWVNIGIMTNSIESAKENIKQYEIFCNPPKVVDIKIHEYENS